MLEATRLARTSVLTLLLIGVLSPVPTSAAVLFDNSKADKNWDITLPSSIPLPGDTNGHYINFFKGFLSLGNPSPVLGPDNAWVTTATTTTARIKKAGNYTCDSLTNGTAGFTVNGPTYNINNAGYFPTDSTPPVSVGTDYCDFHFAGVGIPTGTPLSVAFFGTAAPYAIAGSDSNSGTSFDGFYGNPIPGGFAFQLCDIDGCSGGFSTTTAPTTTPSGPSSVLFLPGIESSRLYEKVLGIENRRWEPTLLNVQHDGEALYSNPDGSSKNQIYTKSGDAIGSVALPLANVDIYKTFFDQLKSLKTEGKISDYEVFPYDWRVAPDDIVTQGVQHEDGTHYLDKDLLALASSSASGKVTVVAHSNGGLVAKALMQKLEHDGLSGKVDKIIFVDVPQIGTPKAINSMLHGDRVSFPSFILKDVTARDVSEYMPDAYDLLPSSIYFNTVSDPVVDLTGAPTLKAASGITTNTITSQADLEKFITPLGGRAKASASDIGTPTVLSQALLSKAKNLHTSIDAWQPPSGVQLVQVAGWGAPTPKGIVYTEKNTLRCTFEKYLCPLGVLIEHNATTTEDGDGTVVISSETAIATTTYYINIPEVSRTSGRYIDHSNITEAIAFQSLFEKVLASTTPPLLPLHVTTDKPDNTSIGARLQLRLHSPVVFDVYDQQGRHTGILHDTTSGADFLEQGIPNVYYYQYGESKFLSVPNDPTIIVRLLGKDTGTFTLDVTTLEQNTSQAITYADIPVTASTTGTIIPTGNITQPGVSIDTNGDGVIDAILTSSIQAQDPLQYLKLIRSNLSMYTLDVKSKRSLDARYANLQTIITKTKKWDHDDDDGDENDVKKGEKDVARVLRKIDRIDTYIRRLLQPEGKNKSPRLTPVQGATLLDMDGILKRLLK